MVEIIDTNGHGHNLVFSTSQEAWETLNEFFICNYDYIVNNGGIAYGTFLASYHNNIHIKNSWVEPTIDFGDLFGYRMQKWTSLVNNYIDLNMLDLTRSKVNTFESKKARSYNVSYLFDNSHNSGKGCLLSLTFSKMYDRDEPILTVSMRSSEITKRLILDLLLIHRMGEYVYGKEARFSIVLSAPQMYTNAETLAMYSRHKSYKKVYKIHGKNKSDANDWEQRVLDERERMATVDPKTINYKLHLRSVKQLQREKHGYEYRPMLAKDLYIVDESIDYPENCITLKDRRKYEQRFKRRAKTE